MKAYAQKHRMDPADFADEFISEDRKKRSRDRHEHFMNDALRHDGRHDDGRDIHDRHKDLLKHREQVTNMPADAAADAAM